MAVCRMLKLLIVLNFVREAEGHATLISPDPRGQDGNLWYQVGCMIGCTCSGASGKELYVTPSTFGCENPMEPTNNDPATRSWNRHNRSAHGDYAKYNPWRAPGHAIPLNGCGIASGFLKGGFERVSEGGKKNFYSSSVPDGYKAGDPGTLVPQVSVTEWTAGATAELEFAIDVNHGGGYQYRLCPKSADEITEDCFQSNPLAFATKNHVIRYTDGSRDDITIPAVDVTEGVKPAGSTWRRFPVPACNCDLGSGCHAQKKDNNDLYGKGSYAATWAYEDGEPQGACTTGLQFPKSWDEGYGYYGPNREGGVSEKPNGKKSAELKGDYSKVEMKCYAIKNSTECVNDPECSFMESKNVCWSKASLEESGKQKKGGKRRLESDPSEADHLAQHAHDHEHEHEHRMLKQSDGSYKCSVCGYVYNPEKHDGKKFEEQPDSFKCPVCTSPKSKFKQTLEEGKAEYYDEVGEKPSIGYLWHIVDKVVVPEKEGDYVLSWRWDCEQTSQVWTNCADIKIAAKKVKSVAGDDTPASPSTDAAAAGATFLGKMALIVAPVALFIM